MLQMSRRRGYRDPCQPARPGVRCDRAEHVRVAATAQPGDEDRLAARGAAGEGVIHGITDTDGHRPARPRQGPHPAEGHLVAGAAGDGAGAAGLRGVRRLGGLRGQELHRGPLHLPVLLAVPGEQVRRPRHPGHPRELVAAVAGADRAAVPTGVPPHLLLLPQGVLPLVLVGAAGVRGARRQGALHRRDQVPADPAEHPPLFLLPGAAVPDHPAVGRDRGLPLPRRLGHGPGLAGAGGERGPAGALHAVVPLLQAPVRRQSRPLLQGAGALLAVAKGVGAELPPHALRLGQPGVRRPDRPVRAPGRHRRHPRPEALLAMADQQTHEYDVVVIGAGGAGLRAAIEASALGARTAVVCKSLLGKAHTVMAEGGVAAALGNVYPEDNWRVHFRDTMRGGKMLNNWRMAQLHAQEAPARVLELEEWGALFDRTKDGRILQRDFGGHKYARLAHVGDRTGLELIRTLQQHAVHKGIEVFMECNIQRLLKDKDRIAGAFGYYRETGRFVIFRAKAVVLASGGVGKSWKFTSNSWECTGDGIALGLDAGADLMDMEF